MFMVSSCCAWMRWMKVGDDAFSDEKIRVRILTLRRVKNAG